MSSKLVFNTTDHFADAHEEGNDVGDFVHIRIQQRNGRKCLTTIQGLATDLDLKKILRFVKKAYSTNGTIIVDPEMGEVMQVQGDQRKNIYEALVEWKICEKGLVKVHGF